MAIWLSNYSHLELIAHFYFTAFDSKEGPNAGIFTGESKSSWKQMLSPF